MRKLASIQKVISTSPIPEADRIELVHVLGWQCVGGKDEFKPDELVVYFEIDSFLPICEEFEFLRKSSYKNNEYMGEGFKLKTMKFKGQISQGLCLGINKLPKLNGLDLHEGDDVTELLNVREWEMPERVTSAGTLSSGRPAYIPKTDETRVQSMPKLFDEFKGLPYYITTKMDGSSHSIGYNDGEITFTSHSCTIKDDGNSNFVEFVKKKGIPEAMVNYAKNNGLSSLVLQGEWCGEGIQRNRLKLSSPEWFIFTAIMNGKRTDYQSLKDVVKEIGGTMVPVEELGEDLTAVYQTPDALLERAEGIGYNNTQREGIIIRPLVPVQSKWLQTDLSMKVLNNKYLMKNED